MATATLTEEVTTEAAKQRAYASGVTFTIGGVPIVDVDVVPVKRPNLGKEASFPLACPECDEPTSVKRQYWCSENPEHGPFEEAGLPHLRRTASGPVWVTKQDMELAKVGTLPKNEVTWAVHPASEVDGRVMSNGVAYRIRPGSKATRTQREMIAALTDLAADEDVAILGVCRLRSSRQLFRLQVWSGQLMMAGLVHPDDLAATDSLELADDAEARVEAAAERLRDWLPVEPFDPEAYRWDVRAEIDRLLADGGAEKPDVPSAEDPGGDVIAFLDAALGSKKTKKKPAKKKTVSKRSTKKVVAAS